MLNENLQYLRSGLVYSPGYVTEDYARANWGIQNLRAALIELQPYLGVESYAAGVATCPDWNGGMRRQEVYAIYSHDRDRLRENDLEEWEAAQAEYQQAEAHKAAWRAANGGAL